MRTQWDGGPRRPGAGVRHQIAPGRSRHGSRRGRHTTRIATRPPMDHASRPGSGRIATNSPRPNERPQTGQRPADRWTGWEIRKSGRASTAIPPRTEHVVEGQTQGMATACIAASCSEGTARRVRVEREAGCGRGIKPYERPRSIAETVRTPSSVGPW